MCVSVASLMCLYSSDKLLMPAKRRDRPVRATAPAAPAAASAAGDRERLGAQAAGAAAVAVGRPLGYFRSAMKLLMAPMLG